MRKRITILIIMLLLGVTTMFCSALGTSDSIFPGKGITVVVNAKTTEQDFLFLEEEEQFFIKQAQSNEAYLKIITYFAEETGTGLMESFPAYYAGAKINLDGSLTIRVYHPSEQEKQLIQNICKDATIVFEEADCSLMHLICVKDDIRDILNQFKEEGKLVSFGLAIYDSTGQINVEINSDQMDEIQMCLDRYIFAKWPEDGNRIVYKSTAGLTGLSTTLHSGDLIDAGETGTLGFKAKYTTAGGVTKYGFVTAGHVLMGSSYVYDSTNILSRHMIGTHICSQASGTADVGFVETASGYTVSSTINGRYITPDSYGLPASNTLCYQYGHMSGTQSGYIQTSLYEGWFVMPNGLQYFTFQIEANINGQPGDSGAVLYYPLNNYYCKIVGVLMGGLITNGVSSTTYYSFGGQFPWDIWPAT